MGIGRARASFVHIHRQRERGKGGWNVIQNPRIRPICFAAGSPVRCLLFPIISYFPFLPSTRSPQTRPHTRRRGPQRPSFLVSAVQNEQLSFFSLCICLMCKSNPSPARPIGRFVVSWDSHMIDATSHQKFHKSHIGHAAHGTRPVQPISSRSTADWLFLRGSTACPDLTRMIRACDTPNPLPRHARSGSANLAHRKPAKSKLFWKPSGSLVFRAVIRPWRLEALNKLTDIRQPATTSPSLHRSSFRSRQLKFLSCRVP